MTVLPDDGLELAGEFPDVPHEQWQRLVAGVLRKSGKDVEGAQAEEALSTALEELDDQGAQAEMSDGDDDGKVTASTWTTAADPRITPFGRLSRYLVLKKGRSRMFLHQGIYIAVLKKPVMDQRFFILRVLVPEIAGGIWRSDFSI